jgi:hypothetical protein
MKLNKKNLKAHEKEILELFLSDEMLEIEI